MSEKSPDQETPRIPKEPKPAPKPKTKTVAGTRAPKRAPLAADWLGDLLKVSKTVAATAKKLDFYRDARREPPEHQTKLLSAQETDLDARVKDLLDRRSNLKSDILSDMRFEHDALHEIEFSYQKAVCFGPGKHRAHSRMFFLPCVYWSNENAAEDQVIDFTGLKGQTLSDFMSSFLDEYFGEEDSLTPHVVLYKKSLKDWNVQDEEEKMLPALHQAILNGREINIDKAFPARARALAQSDGRGWSVAVLPLAVEHDDEAWLESISFEGYEEEFLEEFEEIFDPSSKMDYAAPCDPTIMQDEAVRHLWTKQLELIVKEMIEVKKKKHIGSVESTFVWEDGECVGVVMDFKILDSKSNLDEEGNDVLFYHRKMSRQMLIDETPGQLSEFLVEYPPLIREDFDIVFGHQNQLEAEGGDGGADDDDE